METFSKTVYDEDLMAFAKSITLPNGLLNQGRKDLYKLMRTVRRELVLLNYSIDRYVLTGSIPKQTAIVDADFDCVLFFNGIDPPFKILLEEITTILMNIPDVSDISPTNYTIGFTFKGEIKIDLVPTLNLVRRSKRLSEDQVISIQKREVLRIMRNLSPSERQFYTSGLAESQVVFTKRKSHFVRCIIKLAKCWYKFLCCDEKLILPGLKYLIELVAVFYAQKEEVKRAPSAMHALEAVLKQLSEFDTLKICFQEGQGNPRETQAPYVKDPCNPFDNILEKVQTVSEIKRVEEVISLLEKHAAETLEAMESVRSENDPHVELLPVIFKLNSCEVSFDNNLKFALCFTYFKNWAKYVNNMNSMKSHGDIDKIERIFKLGLLLEISRNQEDWNNVPDLDLACRKVLVQLEEIQYGISNVLEESADLQLCNKLQGIFHPWRGQRELPSLRCYSHHSTSFCAKLKKVRQEYKNVSIFHMPVWEGPCVENNHYFRSNVIYSCVLIIVNQRKQR